MVDYIGKNWLPLMVSLTLLLGGVFLPEKIAFWVGMPLLIIIEVTH